MPRKVLLRLKDRREHGFFKSHMAPRLFTGRKCTGKEERFLSGANQELQAQSHRKCKVST